MNPPYPLPFRNFSDAAYWAGINYCNSSTTPATAYVLPIAGAEAAGVGSGYRFGFGGQEQDNEVSGMGNTMTAEYWEYDARLGRRWNVDPVVKYHESPYASFANNPIWLKDPNGADSVQVNGIWKWKLAAGEDYCNVSGITGIPAENLRAFTQMPDKILREGFMIELQSPIFDAGDEIRIVDQDKYLGILKIKGFHINEAENAYLSLEYRDIASGYDYFNYAQTVRRSSPRKIVDQFGEPTGEILRYPSKDPYYRNGLYNVSNFNILNTSFNDGPSIVFGESLLMENSIVGRHGPASSSNYQYKPLLTLRYFINVDGRTNGLRIATPSPYHNKQIQTAREHFD